MQALLPEQIDDYFQPTVTAKHCHCMDGLYKKRSRVLKPGGFLHLEGYDVYIARVPCQLGFHADYFGKHRQNGHGLPWVSCMALISSTLESAILVKCELITQVPGCSDTTRSYRTGGSGRDKPCYEKTWYFETSHLHRYGP